MKKFRFWKNLIGLTAGKLCQQRMLLAGLALLCFLLPLAAGPAVEAVLTQGVPFSPITLGITAPENSAVPQQLEQVLSGMQDVSRYCRVEAMEHSDALRRLEQGEITAVLVLPDGFVEGVMDGTNPDVELIVSGNRPLEALLTFWVGKSATDLLNAVQSGIYSVLELYARNPQPGLSYQDVVMRINMRYISWTLNRQDIYRIQEIPVTDHLPLGLHYVLSLFFYLLLSLAPMFSGIYDAKWIASQKRFRALGIGADPFFAAALVVCWLAESVLIIGFQTVILKAQVISAVFSGLLCGLFCAVFGSLCCLLTRDTGSCGMLSFTVALLALGLSGGLLPPVLMPGGLQSLVHLSPVTWLRNTAAAACGYEFMASMAAALAISAVVLTGLTRWLYIYQSNRGEVPDL